MNLFTFVALLRINSMKNRLGLLINFLCLSTFGLYAQNPCSSEAHQQFDFWVGEWDVYHATADTIVGHNKIERILNGCVIQENWTGATGFTGKSLNTYNTIDSTWNQVWVDVSGATYHFKGKLEGTTMLMQGQTSNPSGQLILFKMSYTPNKANGNVRQIWKQSSDEGENWTVVFDGIYKRKMIKND